MTRFHDLGSAVRDRGYRAVSIACKPRGGPKISRRTIALRKPRAERKVGNEIALPRGRAPAFGGQILQDSTPRSCTSKIDSLATGAAGRCAGSTGRGAASSMRTGSAQMGGGNGGGTVFSGGRRIEVGLGEDGPFRRLALWRHLRWRGGSGRLTERFEKAANAFLFRSGLITAVESVRRESWAFPDPSPLRAFRQSQRSNAPPR